MALNLPVQPKDLLSGAISMQIVACLTTVPRCLHLSIGSRLHLHWVVRTLLSALVADHDGQLAT